jgi:putative transposase
MFLSIRRETVEKECIIFAMKIRESGYYESLGFLYDLENHIVYGDVLMDLHERWVEEPLLFIADALTGEEEIRQLYPRADFPYQWYASRNFESHVGTGHE